MIYPRFSVHLVNPCGHHHSLDILDNLLGDVLQAGPELSHLEAEGRHTGQHLIQLVPQLHLLLRGQPLHHHLQGLLLGHHFCGGTNGDRRDIARLSGGGGGRVSDWTESQIVLLCHAVLTTYLVQVTPSEGVFHLGCLSSTQGG